MRRTGVLKVGNSQRLRLEVPEGSTKFPGPVGARMSLNSEGRVVVEFYTDPSSPYNWGLYDTKYEVYSVEIPVHAVQYADEAARNVKFTFMEPESYTSAERGLTAVMPKGLLPPIVRNRSHIAPHNRYRPTENPPASAPEAAPAAYCGDAYALVSQLNALLAADPTSSVEMRAGRVVVKQVFG